MKVIKEGKIPEVEIPKVGLFYRGKCEKCGCEFEAHESEFYEDKKEYSTPNFNMYGIEDWARETALYVDCPTCNEKIKIKTVDKEYGHRGALEKDIHWN